MVRNFIIILIVSLASWSCGNETYEGGINHPDNSGNTTIPDDFENSFGVKLDGRGFVVQQIYTVVSTDSNDVNEFIAITASENDYHSIIIYLPIEIVHGTYQYSPISMLLNPNLHVLYSNLDNLLESGVGNGSITIIEHDISNHHIRGHFVCVVNGQSGSIHRITEGEFDITYL